MSHHLPAALSSASAGLDLAAAVCGWTLTKGDPMGAAAWLEARGRHDAARMLKGLTSPVSRDDYDSAQTWLGRQFVALEREASILGRAGGWRRVPLDTKIVAELTAGRASWVGESGAAPAVAGGYSDSIAGLIGLKLVSLAVVSNELVTHAGADAIETVRLALAAQLGEDLDRELLDPDAAAVAGERPGSITNGAASFTSSGPTVADIDADLARMVDAVIAGGARLESAFLVMHPATRLRLALLRDGATPPAYPGLDAPPGQLRMGGLPVYTSMACEQDGSPTSRFLALVCPREVAVAGGDAADITVSTQAALQMDSAPADGAAQVVSLWQNGLTGFRIERTVYWARVRNGVAVLTGFPY